MKKEIYNIAVIGLKMGRFHASSVLENRNAHLYGICDLKYIYQRRSTVSPSFSFGRLNIHFHHTGVLEQE